MAKTNPRTSASVAPSGRVPLSREAILEAAAHLIEHAGLDQFSMRRLGEALGVQAMSLYHHFPSKGHILDALLDSLFASIEPVQPGLAWDEALRQAAHRYRAAIRSRPAFAMFALLHRMNTPTTLAYVESVVRLFDACALPPHETARAFRAFGYFLMGTLVDEVSGYANGPTAAEPLSQDEQKALAPTLVALAPFFQPGAWDSTFEYGLDAMIEHCRARQSAARASGASLHPPETT